MDSTLPDLNNCSTETSATECKRSKARHILMNKMNDRSFKGHVKWKKSVNEVHIDNYKNPCRKNGSPPLLPRHNLLTSGLARKEDTHNSDSMLMSHSYFTPGKNDSKFISQNERRKKVSDVGYGLQREMTLSEIHNLMRNNHNGKDIEPPKIRINIHRSFNGETPRVKLMLTKLPPHSVESRSNSRNRKKSPAPFGRLRSQSFEPEEFATMPGLDDHGYYNKESVTSDRGKVNSLSDNPLHLLQRLEREKMTSIERTRVWLSRNPLGPESAPEDLQDEFMKQLKKIAPLEEIEKQSFNKERIKTSIDEIPNLKPHSVDSIRKKEKTAKSAFIKDKKVVRFGANSWLYPEDDDPS